jgi:hypothetical protein
MYNIIYILIIFYCIYKLIINNCKSSKSSKSSKINVEFIHPASIC